MSADVAVIGAGVVGASVAFHLAKLGRKVVVLERGLGRGEGSTGRATGGFRAQFETEVNVRLSLLSRDKLRRFSDEVGADPGYLPCGYLWLADSDAQLAALGSAQELQHRCGLTEARLVTNDEILCLQPAASLEGIAGGAFCPTDGFIRPLGILSGYLDAAARLGVEVRHGAPVERFELDASGITTVIAGGARLPVGAVVNAAGPWAAEVAALAGVELPVAPLRRQIAVTAPFAGLPAEMPMTIWLRDGFHLRVRDGRVLLLLPSAPAADRLSTQVDDAWVEEVVAIARRRIPLLTQATLDRAACTAGLYEMSPDRHAIVGRAAGLKNFFLACGSSGHGSSVQSQSLWRTSTGRTSMPCLRASATSCGGW